MYGFSIVVRVAHLAQHCTCDMERSGMSPVNPQQRGTKARSSLSYNGMVASANVFFFFSFLFSVSCTIFLNVISELS